MVEARRHDPDFDVTRSWDMPDIPILPGDEPVDGYLCRVGFNETQLQYVRRSYANAAGDDKRFLSAEAAREDWRDTSAGTGDFRILDGYDCLINDLAKRLAIHLNTVVETVEWGVGGVRVHTSSGVFEADQAIITLPLGVLQSGRVRFVPELPADKQTAIAGLRMGPVIKLIYRFEEAVLPLGILALYSAGNPPMWWSPSFGQEAGTVVMTALASGDYARDLLALGEAGALAKALGTLHSELNRPDLTPTDSRLVNWVGDPFSCGGYSVTPPGQAGTRAVLAQPVDNRLFWAGEATAPNPWAATVHGAYASGQRAAREILDNF